MCSLRLHASKTIVPFTLKVQGLTTLKLSPLVLPSKTLTRIASSAYCTQNLFALNIHCNLWLQSKLCTFNPSILSYKCTCMYHHHLHCLLFFCHLSVNIPNMFTPDGPRFTRLQHKLTKHLHWFYPGCCSCCFFCFCCADVVVVLFGLCFQLLSFSYYSCCCCCSWLNCCFCCCCCFWFVFGLTAVIFVLIYCTRWVLCYIFRCRYRKTWNGSWKFLISWLGKWLHALGLAFTSKNNRKLGMQDS